ncbi:hypothetical protein AVDCRST_MAG82-1415, partial [uncultured Rubrobacteraceae bacterium]
AGREDDLSRDLALAREGPARERGAVLQHHQCPAPPCE